LDISNLVSGGFYWLASRRCVRNQPSSTLRVRGGDEVGVGDEIVKVADGPERLTITAVDALPYLPEPVEPGRSAQE
jgi:hypothetical protein